MPYGKGASVFLDKACWRCPVRSSMSKSKRSRQLIKAGAKGLTEWGDNCYFFILFLDSGCKDREKILFPPRDNRNFLCISMIFNISLPAKWFLFEENVYLCSG